MSQNALNIDEIDLRLIWMEFSAKEEMIIYIYIFDCYSQTVLLHAIQVSHLYIYIYIQLHMID